MIVRSTARNEGRIVRCVRLATQQEAKEARFLIHPVVWVLGSPLVTQLGFSRALCYDANLRPIRDPSEDAQDETLQWLPAPIQHKETA